MRLAATGLIMDSEKRILLLKRSNYTKAFPFAWTFPWWRWEEWETPEEIVIREVKEETWLDFAPIKVFENYETNHPWEKNWSVHIYRFIGDFSWKIKIQEEEADWYAWYTYEETKKLKMAFDYVEVIERLYDEWLVE